MINKMICLILSIAMTIPTIIIKKENHVQAQTNARYMERLDRGLIAVKTGNTGIYLSWRLLGTEEYATFFNVYRDGVLITTVTDSTNYKDAQGTVNSKYTVAPVLYGVVG